MDILSNNDIFCCASPPELPTIPIHEYKLYSFVPIFVINRKLLYKFIRTTAVNPISPP